MTKYFLYLLLVLSFNANSATWDQTIQSMGDEYISNLETVECDRVPGICKDFEKLKTSMGLDVKLIVATRSITGFQQGKIVVIGAQIEIYSQLQRQFIIAHELAHAKKNDHKKRLEYTRTKVQTEFLSDVDRDGVFAELTRISNDDETIQNNWNMELSADTDAMDILRNIGWTKEQIIQAFQGFKFQTETKFHPSTKFRLQYLKDHQ